MARKNNRARIYRYQRKELTSSEPNAIGRINNQAIRLWQFPYEEPVPIYRGRDPPFFSFPRIIFSLPEYYIYWTDKKIIERIHTLH